MSCSNFLLKVTLKASLDHKDNLIHLYRKPFGELRILVLHTLIRSGNRYRTAGYCCEVQIFATVLKWPLAEISAIAEFATHEANLHWILCQENAWANFTHSKI